ncbi:LLM class flavin-dependent oxidoreductase, partial [Streptomyces sp. B1866]|uniref:MupA/Atu3671 family FMN-dependent luciferase-like monooxygenase n=1 Tax=Streptomyces sp. B1866 TaxID=3075431 RepID=UPI00288F9E71
MTDATPLPVSDAAPADRAHTADSADTADTADRADAVPLPATPEERRALLADRLRRRLAGRGRPLSYPQRRLWFLDQLDPVAAVYAVPLTYRIRGPLDVPALERALAGVVRRHHVLRTVFRPVDGEPRQFVRPSGPVAVPVVDVSGHADPEGEAGRRCREEARRPFDLTADPMLRPLLLRLAPADHRLCLTLHHIACDGWSLDVLAAELTALYEAEATGAPAGLAPLPAQYADFAERQAAELADGPPADLIGYWRGRLAGAPALCSLPADRPRPPAQSHAGAHVEFAVEEAVATRVAELARQTAATPFAVLLAAFAALAHAYTGDGEVIVGSPVAGRTRPQARPLIGFFANTVVQRLDVSGNPPFRELVARARDESRAAVAHQDLPFEKLVEELRPRRDPAHNPVFQMLFSYHEAAARGLELTGCQVAMEPGDTGTAKFDLTLSLVRAAGRLTGRLEYSTDLFEDRTARDLCEQYRTLLAAAVADPDRPVGALPVLTPAQARRFLADAHGPADAPAEALMPELIARQAARTPGAPAVVGAAPGAPALTYGALLARADALAARLRARGVGPDVPVGVYLDRSPDLVVALLAVLRAGGAYLPLDPAYPARRLAFMVADARAPVVVTRAGLARRAGRTGAEPVVLDAPEDPEDPEDTPSETADPRGPSPGHLAYVVYTSGSTGRPKGVMISHRNLQTFLGGMDALLDGDPPDTWLAVTSVSFDISVLELLWTLACGYRVVLRADEPSAAASLPAPAGPRPRPRTRPLEFSLFYFGGDRGGSPDDAYRLLMEGARFADRNGFTAVWTPERHFHEFGGLYPNPAVTAAAVAAVTERVAVRAGSVVLPLHDPLRVAEEWAVVDHLSRGRVGVSVASGWQPADFCLAPDRYADRKKAMLDGLAELRALWRGEAVTRRTGAGTEARVRTYPAPVQPELPVWLTSARSPETFEAAGACGAGLLTHLLGHGADQLAEKIRRYRAAWRAAGHPGDGHVTLMLHTFLGTDGEAVRELVREPLCAYLKTSFDLLAGLGDAAGPGADPRALPEAELDQLVARAFDRFYDTSGLLGTPEACTGLLDRLTAAGVDEIACLIDFGVAHQRVLDALEHLADLRDLTEQRRRAALADEPLAEQLRRHRVTHLQCTPGVAGTLARDEDAAPRLAGLRRLLVGGEALPAPLAARLGELLPGRAHNMYGPTEATVWATTAAVGGPGPVTIGRPLPGVRAYVADAYLRPAPVGVPGELLLGGPGVARGYLGRPGLTAERFVPDPFSGEPGARLYRTGDLVRRRADGELEFLGRLDHQVKVLGHRIELGEVENALRAHPGVAEAVVTVRGRDEHSRITAYCVPARASGLPAREGSVPARGSGPPARAAAGAGGTAAGTGGTVAGTGRTAAGADGEAAGPSGEAPSPQGGAPAPDGRTPEAPDQAPETSGQAPEAPGPDGGAPAQDGHALEAPGQAPETSGHAPEAPGPDGGAPAPDGRPPEAPGPAPGAPGQAPEAPGLTAEALRAFAARTLPASMLPADVVLLDALPTTPNGKVDRSRLPDPRPRPAAGYQPPRDDRERRVARALAEALGAERVGVEDNFFEAGGNSLLAVRARALLRPVLGDGLSLVDLFRYPTARALAAAFDTAAGGGAAGPGPGAGPGADDDVARA